MQGKLRLFFALVPSASVRAQIEGAAAELLQRHAPGGRPTRPEKLHLTLAFLGEPGEADAMQRACHAGAQVATAAFGFVLDSAESFHGTRPTWVLRGEGAPFAPLLAQLMPALHAAGLPPHDAQRAFVPHVTVLRSARVPLPRAPIAPIAWPARDFALMGSQPGEPRYLLVERWPLRA